MWSNGTERNLKLIEAFFPWEVSPDQNTLRTLPKRWRLEEISGGETLAQDGCLQDLLSSQGDSLYRSNASINLTGYCPPQADPLANNVFRQNPRPGDSFSVKNSGHQVEKNETKSPPPGIICQVRMPRYQRNRVSFQIFQFSFIMRIKSSQVFIQHLQLILFEV